MKEILNVLLVDDDEEEFFLLKELIASSSSASRLRLHLDWVSTFDAALKAFAECHYDAYLIDYRLGNKNGLDLIRAAGTSDCSVPVIMLTGQGNYEIDLAAMQSGASDYLVKGELSLPLLERSLRYAIDRKQVENDLAKLVQARTHDLALLQRQASELNALHKATASLMLNVVDIPVLMGQILDAAQEAIPAADCGRLLLVGKPDLWQIESLKTELDDPRIRVLQGHQEQQKLMEMFHPGQSVRIDDAQQQPELLQLLSDVPNSRPVRSLLVVPMVINGYFIGILSLTASKPGVFTNSDIRLLTSFAATATAATQNAILYNEVKNLATTDPLTGQYNRRAFFEHGKRETERFKRFGHPLSAIMFDIDHFKEVNDTLGHSAGDQVLSEIVVRCVRVVRQVDIIGRYGGDEFAILLPEADWSKAREIAERIRSAVLGSPITTDAGPVSVSVSLGVAQASREATDLSALLECADQALYQSKQTGRNCVHVFGHSPKPVKTVKVNK